MNKPLVFLLGPTAAGKSAVSLSLAKKMKIEVVSCDSMQVYRGMDIITSKPEFPEQEAVRHHLIDVARPWQEFDVSQYRRLALEAVAQIHKRGALPLFVGGTGLYVSVVVDGIFQADTRDEALREKLRRKAAEFGSERLHERLSDIDPGAAAKIHPRDTRRIIRALEVYAITGRPMSLWQKQREGLGPEYAVRMFGLRMEPDALYRRISTRVERMFDAGIVREVKGLLKKRLSRTACAAIGIAEIKGYLDGEYGEDEAKRLMERNTRQYARRQMTWFRKEKRIEWIEVAEEERPEETAGRIEKMLK